MALPSPVLVCALVALKYALPYPVFSQSFPFVKSSELHFWRVRIRTPSSQNRIPRKHPMTRPILHIHRRNPHTLPIHHHKIQRKPLNEELNAVLQALPIQRMQHRMPRSIRRTRRPIRLAAFSILQGLASESALVDCPICCAREGHTVVFEFDDGGHGFARHVVDCVLVTEPVGAFDCVVHVPAPVVFGHAGEAVSYKVSLHLDITLHLQMSCNERWIWIDVLPQRRINPPLRSNRMRSRRKQFRHARRLQARLSQAHSSAEAGSACAYDDGTVRNISPSSLSNPSILHPWNTYS